MSFVGTVQTLFVLLMIVASARCWYSYRSSREGWSKKSRRCQIQWPARGFVGSSASTVEYKRWYLLAFYCCSTVKIDYESAELPTSILQKHPTTTIPWNAFSYIGWIMEYQILNSTKISCSRFSLSHRASIQAPCYTDHWFGVRSEKWWSTG